jgi:spermidine synthase
VLIGGLGLGYTLKRVLEIVGPGAVVHVSELLPEIVQWNRDFLRGVNGSLIEDPRVKVIIKDVFDVIRGAKGEHAYDSILLDTDHTPSSWVQSKNSRLYERAGFNWVTRALRANGLVAYWSAGAEPDFVHNLSRAGVRVQTYEAKAPSIYAEFVWESRKKQMLERRRTIDWLVVRNRMTPQETHNRKRLTQALTKLSQRIGFRLAPGLSERVIYRELFPKGLTVIDLIEGRERGLTMAQIAARAEVRGLISSLRLPQLGRSLAAAG